MRVNGYLAVGPDAQFRGQRFDALRLSNDDKKARRFSGSLELRSLYAAPASAYVELHNLPLVQRHMPLSGSSFGEAACTRWLATKAAMWTEFGYGPWSFFADGVFIGWGGLQPEDGDADLALVIHPEYWGYGLRIYREIVSRVFGPMGFTSITALLPPSRSRVGVMRRLLTFP